MAAKKQSKASTRKTAPGAKRAAAKPARKSAAKKAARPAKAGAKRRAKKPIAAAKDAVGVVYNDVRRSLRGGLIGRLLGSSR